jgi:ABC-type siderophore export system fused ATPase/permease subunit
MADIKRKRFAFLRSLAQIGIDLGSISVQLTFYIVIAALTLFLGGAYLILNLPSPEGLAWYTTILILVIVLQIIRMVRLHREKVDRENWETEVSDLLFSLKGRM